MIEPDAGQCLAEQHSMCDGQLAMDEIRTPAEICRLGFKYSAQTGLEKFDVGRGPKFIPCTDTVADPFVGSVSDSGIKPVTLGLV